MKPILKVSVRRMIQDDGAKNHGSLQHGKRIPLTMKVMEKFGL